MPPLFEPPRRGARTVPIRSSDRSRVTILYSSSAPQPSGVRQFSTIHALAVLVNRTDPALHRSLGTWARRELLHVLGLSGQMWRVNFSVKAAIAGTRVRIPVVFSQGPQNLALLEPGVFGAFKRILPLRRGAVLDVGMNVGQTLLKVKVLDASRPYIGFDTNPRCCHYVDQLDRNGIATLWLRPNVSLDPSATMVDGVYDDASGLRRQCASVCRGDDVVTALNVEEVAIIKIDTEGA
jgi:hypothetical protein